MANLQELRDTRLQKLEMLKKAGMNPYPASVSRTHTLWEIRDGFEGFESSGETVSVVGRIMSLRGQGSIMFATLFDGTDRFQAVFKKDEIAEDLYELFVQAIDLGDYISVTGTLFVTQKGEKSLLVKEWVIATKSLLPIPTEHFGIEDEDEKTRKRYLDALTDPSLFNRFKLRSQIIKYIRNFFDSKGFLEIETPILQNQAGGAMARTFNTYHNDYAMDMVLRISLEIEHKVMMTAGYNRIYEIGKNFRNEGSDPTHIQEFTMMEWYAAYETLETNMQWTEDLLRGLAKDVIGKMTFKVQDKDGVEHEVDFGGIWPRVRFGDLLKQNAGIDMETISMDDLRAEAKKWGMPDEETLTTGRGNLLDHIYKKSSRNNIIQPTFVTHYPSSLKPLAQQNADGTAEVYQLIIAGAELNNAYAELVDPVVQRHMLEEQSAAKAGGDAEAMEIDERFLSAMEYGMPPMTGFGMGIDRLIAVLTEQHNLRDVIFFPIMRPKDDSSKKKETMIAVAVVNTGIGLEKWQEMNTVAHLNAAFGARVGKQKLFTREAITTKDNRPINLNVKNAIIIKSARASEELRILAEKAKADGLEVEEFTREMIETTNDKKVIENILLKNFDDIEYLGVLVFGPKGSVEEVTGQFERYS
jgi:lysyl-tRNA synthetase class 2